MNSSRREKAAAASAEICVPKEIQTGQDSVRDSLPGDSPFVAGDELPDPRPQSFPADGSEDPEMAGPLLGESVPAGFDLSDFDDEFDDDFEAETAGEYELDDDEYARALLDIVDFDIEGLEAYRDDE